MYIAKIRDPILEIMSQKQIGLSEHCLTSKYSQALIAFEQKIAGQFHPGFQHKCCLTNVPQKADQVKKPWV